MEVAFAPQFKRLFKHLDPNLQEEVLEKIELFKELQTNPQLKVHKLKGRLKGRHSFSVNYQTSLLLDYLSKEEAVLLAVGSHDVYSK